MAVHDERPEKLYSDIQLRKRYHFSWQQKLAIFGYDFIWCELCWDSCSSAWNVCSLLLRSIKLVIHVYLHRLSELDSRIWCLSVTRIPLNLNQLQNSLCVNKAFCQVTKAWSCTDFHDRYWRHNYEQAFSNTTLQWKTRDFPTNMPLQSYQRSVCTFQMQQHNRYVVALRSDLYLFFRSNVEWNEKLDTVYPLNSMTNKYSKYVKLLKNQTGSTHEL